MNRRITQLIVHHSADTNKRKQVKIINEWHRQRGFEKSQLGFFVGYHYVIEKDGTVVQTRYDNEVGAHDKGENLYSIGICLAGNFDTERPTGQQITALGSLLVRLLHQYELRYSDIVPHRRYDTTSCYGRRLSDDWAQMIYIASEPRLTLKVKLWILKHLLKL